MLSDDEFYEQIKPYLRAKSAGRAQVITPKDASATRSNGEKEPEGVTESIGPNGPKLSIIVRYRGSAVPESQRASRYRGNDNRIRSASRTGWAKPLVIQDDPGSPVDGIVILDDGTSDKVKISKVQSYDIPPSRGYGQTVAFALSSLTKEDTAYIIEFHGATTKSGHFQTNDKKLNDIANDWMVRWMLRKEHGR